MGLIHFVDNHNHFIDNHFIESSFVESSFCRKFVSLKVHFVENYFVDSSFRRQFISTTIHVNLHVLQCHQLCLGKRELIDDNNCLLCLCGSE